MMVMFVLGMVDGRCDAVDQEGVVFTSRKGCEVSLVWAGERMGEDYAEACDKHSDGG